MLGLATRDLILKEEDWNPIIPGHIFMPLSLYLKPGPKSQSTSGIVIVFSVCYISKVCKVYFVALGLLLKFTVPRSPTYY